jgi:hypothetical protein
VKQLAMRAGHPWHSTKRILDLYLLKDSLRLCFRPTPVPRHYQLKVFNVTVRSVDPESVKRALRGSKGEGAEEEEG